MTNTAPSTKPPAAAIYALNIERFRGITSIQNPDWRLDKRVSTALCSTLATCIKPA
jgi:hypothetical protein